jgi:nucleoside-diphosphate-sugar epimerase
VPKEYKAIQADRKDVAAMREALTGVKPDVVVNFIGYEVGELEVDYELFKGVVRQYIFISSTVVYERPAKKLPYAEDVPQQNPWWDYAQKKIACEAWLRARQAEGFPVTIVRPSHTYSKRWVPNAVSSGSFSFAKRLEGGKPVYVHDEGESPWTLTAASDFAVGLGGLVGNGKAVGEAFHITSDEVLTWNQIYAEIAKAVGAKETKIIKVPTDFICEVVPSMIGNLKGDKAHAGVFDNSLIRRFVPEFLCAKPFRVGVREAVDWLRAHPEQQNLSAQVDETIEKVIKTWEERGGSR